MEKQMDNSNASSSKYLRKNELAARHNISLTTLERRVKAGIYPKPLVVNRIWFFDLDAVLAWETKSAAMAQAS
jgi:hypothetical protein